MTVTDRLIDGLGPGFVRLAGPLLAPIVAALVADVEGTDAMLTAPDGRWPALFDLELTADPGWLAQLAGVPVDPTLDVDQQRALILDRPAWATGTYVALLAALKGALIGLKRATIAERDLSPWHATITVYESDYAPGMTQQRLQALAEAHRPAGMTFDYVFFAPTSYGAAELDAETYADAESTAGTYADAES